MSRRPYAVSALGVALAMVVAQAGARPGVATNALDAIAAKAAAATYREFVEMLALPNVSVVSAADMQKNAAFLDTAFQRRGFKTILFILLEPFQ